MYLHEINENLNKDIKNYSYFKGKDELVSFDTGLYLWIKFTQ